MVLWANKKGYPIRVFTTLIGMQEADIDILEGIPFRSFKVHLPSLSKYDNIKITDNYVKILSRLKKSKIKVTNYHIHSGQLHSHIRGTLDKEVVYTKIHSRAGNLIRDEVEYKRRNTHLKCRRLHFPVVCPNGDAVVCCMDFGMKYILGNLLEKKYHDLFESKKYKEIIDGLKNPKKEIICRYCARSIPNGIFD